MLTREDIEDIESEGVLASLQGYDPMKARRRCARRIIRQAHNAVHLPDLEGVGQICGMEDIQALEGHLRAIGVEERDIPIALKLSEGATRKDTGRSKQTTARAIFRVRAALLASGSVLHRAL